MDITLTDTQERLCKFFLSTGLIFALLIFSLSYSSGLLQTNAQLLDYAGHAAFWFVLALIPNAISCLICKEGMFSPILGFNMLSLWCGINMLAPAVYGFSGNGLYLLTDNIDLGSFYNLSFLGCLILWGVIKFGDLDADTSHCRCERKH